MAMDVAEPGGTEDIIPGAAVVEMRAADASAAAVPTDEGTSDAAPLHASVSQSLVAYFQDVGDIGSKGMLAIRDSLRSVAKQDATLHDIVSVERLVGSGGGQGLDEGLRVLLQLARARSWDFNMTVASLLREAEALTVGT